MSYWNEWWMQANSQRIHDLEKLRDDYLTDIMKARL